MTAVPLPVRGRWVWDSRGEGRGLRVSAHAEAGLLNLSIWRDDTCVGTARLVPAEAARLVAAVTDGLAELAAAAGRHESPAGSTAEARRLHELELRLARLEHELQTSPWRRVVPTVAAWARRTFPPERRG